MTSRNINSPTMNLGSNGAAILSAAYTTRANCARSRAEVAWRLKPSPTRPAVSKRPKCCLNERVFMRTLFKVICMTLASELACLFAVENDWPKSLIYAPLSVVATLIMVNIVMILAVLTQRSRAMLATILMPQKKLEDYVAQETCDRNSTLDF